MYGTPSSTKWSIKNKSMKQGGGGGAYHLVSPPHHSLFPVFKSPRRTLSRLRDYGHSEHPIKELRRISESMVGGRDGLLLDEGQNFHTTTWSNRLIVDGNIHTAAHRLG